MAVRVAIASYWRSYDFRSRQTRGVISTSTEILEQVKWLDDIGADLVWFGASLVDDGYLPNWCRSGVNGQRDQTRTLRYDICLIPFNHPFAAEDLAVLDNLSGGQVDLGIGMGPHEFKDTVTCPTALPDE